MNRKAARIEQLKSTIPEVSVKEASRLQQEGAVLFDVREPDEVAGGLPVGALPLVRGFLELRVEAEIPDTDQAVMVMCRGGVRSLFAAEGLNQLGYTNVSSVAGGFLAWKEAGLPIEIPHSLDAAGQERYARHLLIPEVGPDGQQKLLDSKVLLVGAGGLGSPAAYYLAAAGIGELTIIDDDIVDRSNLQRQILHKDWQVGSPKVDSARQALHQLNPSIKIETVHARLDSSNIDEVFDGQEVIVDGSDNFATRYLVNDACVKFKIPNVHGSIFRFEGQVSVFWPTYPERRGPCYRCLFPEPPPPELAPSCAEAGVLGVLPGVIGTLEAVETVKILLGIGNPLVGRLLTYDALRASFLELEQRADPDCAYCAEGKDFPGYIDYGEFCGSAGN